MMVVEDIDMINQITKQLYPEIAHKFKTTYIWFILNNFIKCFIAIFRNSNYLHIFFLFKILFYFIVKEQKSNYIEISDQEKKEKNLEALVTNIIHEDLIIL